MSHCKSKQSWGLESYDLKIRLMKNQGCLLENLAKYWKEKDSIGKRRFNVFKFILIGVILIRKI